MELRAFGFRAVTILVIAQIMSVVVTARRRTGKKQTSADPHRPRGNPQQKSRIMNIFRKITAVAALGGLAACSMSQPPAPPTPSPPSSLSAADTTFVQTVAEANLTEVALGKIALTNAGTSGVKSFAQHAISEHTSAEDRLSTIASAHGITLPTAPNADDQKIITELGGIKGAKFDKGYIANAITAHTDAVQLAGDEAASTSDADLKSFATDFQKTAQAHLEAAQALKSHKGHPSVYRGKRHVHAH
ncbi:DUF4142 domain-containing protein [Acetobacter sicerae]|nr:DUF4142 domain-containing protein [Acetobacter sicerae]